MRPVLTSLLLLLLLLSSAACGVQRVPAELGPDEPLPDVPPPPQAALAAKPPPRVVLMIVPGLDPDGVAAGIAGGSLQAFARVRAEGTLCEGSGGTDAPTELVARLVAAAAASERRVVALFPPQPPDGAAASLGVRVLRDGPAYALAPGDVRYTVVVERDGAPIVTPSGTTLSLRPAQESRAHDTFLVPLERAALATTLEVRVAKDRASGSVLSTENEVEIRPGRWSEPLRVRFERDPAPDLIGRTRVYLVPRGIAQLRLLVAAPALDPSFPSSWDWEGNERAASAPIEFAGALDGGLLGPLPPLDGGMQWGAFDDGLIDARDAAATIEAAHRAASRLFQGMLVAPDHELLVQRFPLIEHVARLGPGEGEERDETIEFLGGRIARVHLADAALVEIDRLLGAALDVAAEDAGRDVTIVLWSPHPRAGLLAINRAPAGAIEPVDAERVLATALQRLGIGEIPDLRAAPLPLGVTMGKAPTVELTVPKD